MMGEIRVQWKTAAKALAAWSKGDWLRARLALDLKRLIRARNEGWPEEYVNFVRTVCVGIMEEMVAKRA